jgi:tetratricopeptide (TPR) repeat protein
LCETLLSQQRFVAAEIEIERLLAADSSRLDGRLLTAELAKCRGDRNGAKRELDSAAQDYPEASEPLEALARFCFEDENWPEAIRTLRALTARVPNDGAAHRNLGTACLRLGEYEEAVDCLKSSLEVRPDSAMTHAQLGEALLAFGKHDEAIEALEAALRISPDLQQAWDVLERVNAS